VARKGKHVTESAAHGPLQARTPVAWFDAATGHRDELLLDHANCEKKAASTALSLMFAYPEDTDLCARMSRLAREELRHFELVQAKLKELAVPFRRMSPSRYGAGLRRAVRREEPARCLDLLICGALIEARSHERFMGLTRRFEPVVASFYASLAAAEARHADLYLRLAQSRAVGFAERLQALAEIEAELATAPDPQFRFHSGPPV